MYSKFSKQGVPSNNDMVTVLQEYSSACQQHPKFPIHINYDELDITTFAHCVIISILSCSYAKKQT